MKISMIKELLEADVVCGEELLGNHVYSACGMDMVCIVQVRSKLPTPEMIELAKESGIVLLSSKKRMYDACGILYTNGLVGNKLKS